MSQSYIVLCPRCPKSWQEAGADFSNALVQAQQEERHHNQGGCEIWVSVAKGDGLPTGAPMLWHADGKAFGFKDVEPPPLVFSEPDGSLVRLRFPIPSVDEGEIVADIIVEKGRPLGMN